MEFQNENGTAAKGAAAKENTNPNTAGTAKANWAKNTEAGAAKANPDTANQAGDKPANTAGNNTEKGKADTKNMRPSVPGNEKKALPPQAGTGENKDVKKDETGHEANGNASPAAGAEGATNPNISGQGEAPHAGQEAIGEFQDINNSRGSDSPDGDKNGHALQTLNRGVALSQNRGAEHAEAKQHINTEPKPELTLDAKLKAIAELNRKSIQRFTLIGRIKTLEDFEIKLFEGSDELTNNPYQGCKLIIEDDKKNQFTTNTPGLIRMVSQFIYDACVEKLKEIESTIVFPQA
jgi:hypothetical protein